MSSGSTKVTAGSYNPDISLISSNKNYNRSLFGQESVRQPADSPPIDYNQHVSLIYGIITILTDKIQIKNKR
jgi:hypothetical protein